MRSLALALSFMLLLPLAAPAQEGFAPLTAWRAYNGTGIPAGWTVAANNVSYQPGIGGGDLVSADSFRNFELAFDWRIAAGGNSGVMYRVVENDAAYSSGPEYQILDNAGHADGQSPPTSAASVYGLYPPHSDLTRPAGQWNSARIVVDGQHVEHWLNDDEVLEYDLGSADWAERVAASKFSAWPEFGKAERGHINLQDHGNAVDYRNIRIRILPD